MPPPGPISRRSQVPPVAQVLGIGVLGVLGAGVIVGVLVGSLTVVDVSVVGVRVVSVVAAKAGGVVGEVSTINSGLVVNLMKAS